MIDFLVCVSTIAFKKIMMPKYMVSIMSQRRMIIYQNRV